MIPFVATTVVVAAAFAAGRFVGGRHARRALTRHTAAVRTALDGLDTEIDALTGIADEMQAIRTEHGRRPLSPELVAWAAADALNPEGES